MGKQHPGFEALVAKGEGHRGGSKSHPGFDKLVAKGEGHEPMIKPSHKGLLHRKLGVPQGEKIPEAKLEQALHSKSASERKEANFAKTAERWKK